MNHNGVFFDDIHSYEDLNLILSAVVIPPAVAKTNYVDIPGADGEIDLTEALGEVKYYDRDGVKFTLTMNPAGDLSESAWEAKKTEISNLLNGKRCKVRLDKDPDYYWQGRLSVDEYLSDRRIRQFVVGAKFAPYKLKNEITRVVCPAGQNVFVTLENGRMRAIPTITTKAQATIVFNGSTFTLNAGAHKNLNIILYEGEYPVTVTSTQPVEFAYQEGDL